MPLVFIHGVNTRRGSTPAAQQAFDGRVQLRDGLFRQVAFADRVKPPARMHSENPYWGDLGAKFAWDLACVPKEDSEAFGAISGGTSEEDVLQRVALETAGPAAEDALKRPNAVLLTLARTASLGAAVDALTASATAIRPPGAATADLDAWGTSLAAFAVRASLYARQHPRPDWLTAVQTDGPFLDRLAHELEGFEPGAATSTAKLPAAGDETFGLDEVLNHLKQAAGRLGQAAQAAFTRLGDTVRAGAAQALDQAGGVVGDISLPVIIQVRPAVSTFLGQFFGDVFVYLQTRGPKEDPGPIVREVIAAIDCAIAAKTPGDEELYLVAHSMGGNIIYDILTYYRPDIQCDLLLTVGTQVGLMEEIKVFQVSDPRVGKSSGGVVPRPPNVKHWVNVYDLTDLFGFTTEGIFTDVQDYKFDTDALPLVSHTMYFERPRFHERLRERIHETLGEAGGNGG